MREQLAQWDFVIASYVLGLVSLVLLCGWAWRDMRRAEKRRDNARGK